MIPHARRLCRQLALLVNVVGSSAVAQPARPDPALARLEARFAELAKGAGGTVGVAVVHLESGRAAYLNRAEAFPMASTVNVPLAVQLLTRVDRGTAPASVQGGR